jgi:DnaJ-class molecular chaperone with C-terminal Zn finger domain
MEQSTVCPWCQTEITWDEETGPENVCPYCENELGDYRTINVEIERDDDESDESGGDGEKNADAGIRSRFSDDMDMDSFRPVNLRLIALEGKLEAILNEQLEVPECPSCREYMIEAGTQTVKADGWEPAAPPAVKRAILPAPFRLVWYVCPNCHHAHSRLAPEDRERLLGNLEGED